MRALRSLGNRLFPRLSEDLKWLARSHEILAQEVADLRCEVVEIRKALQRDERWGAYALFDVYDPRESPSTRATLLGRSAVVPWWTHRDRTYYALQIPPLERPALLREVRAIGPCLVHSVIVGNRIVAGSDLRDMLVMVNERVEVGNQVEVRLRSVECL